MNLPELFRYYLKTQKASSVTIKNYVADIRNFLDWLANKTGIRYQVAGKSIFGLLTQETIEEYKKDLANKHTPLSSINRCLSALRKFGQFGISRGWLAKNEASQVKNLRKSPFDRQLPNERILAEFRRHLEAEKVSQITIKNYLSDLRHFLSWLEITV